MRPPTRTISGSPTWSRSRASAWLIADGVLPSFFRRPGHAAFRHQRLEHYEEVQVDPVKLNFLHDR
jgi:hypothetical protein